MTSSSDKKIKILRVCPAPGNLDEFRRKYQLRRMPYEEQIKILHSENFLLPGGFAACMGQLGFEVFDCLYDDAHLQATWAEENGFMYHLMDVNPLFHILKRQVEAFKPDVILFWAGGFFRVDRSHRDQLRALLGGRVVMTGVWGDELPFGETYAAYFGDLDFCFVMSRGYQRLFTQSGLKSFVIGASFDDSIKYDSTVRQEAHDFIFCGYTGYGNVEHTRRYEILSRVAARRDIRIFTSKEKMLWRFRRRIVIRAIDAAAALPGIVLAAFARIPNRSILRKLRLRKAINLAQTARKWDVGVAAFFTKSNHPKAYFFNYKKPIAKLFPNKVARGPLETSAYLSLLAQSKIVLNIHRDEKEDVGNIRVFEATGVGACLLTDHGEELSELFDVNNEIVTFTDADDCMEKVEYLLSHPEERSRIAANGQRRTLGNYTVMKRCETIARVLRQELDHAADVPAYVYATYDVGRYPISYDIAFFVESAEIVRQKCQAKGTIINIVHPTDIATMPGIPNEADAFVNMHGREFRIAHICAQVARLFPDVSVNEIRQRETHVVPMIPEVRMIPFPGPDMPHHAEYYRMVNSNPGLVRGFSASKQALTYVEEWLSTFLRGKRLITITIRCYAFDTMRNSKLEEWAKFIRSLDSNIYEVVIIPDTDQIATYSKSVLSRCRAFWLGSFDVDLRFALYERAYLNMFVNNGPGTASSLNRKVRLLMFKLMVMGTPRSAGEFIEWQGFKIGRNPPYATKFQRWVWEEDDFPVIEREFNKMVREIETSGPIPSDGALRQVGEPIREATRT